jgi:hypothetical protein
MLIDNFAADWLQELEAAYHARGEGSAVHVLIDGVFVPRLHSKLTPESTHILFEGLPGFNASTRDVSPFLVEYSPDDKKLRAVLDACNGWPMVSAITTTESARSLAGRLADWCVVDADGEYLNFRFPDTRRLPDILEVLDVEQRAQFTGPATSWRYIGRTGTWIVAPLTARLVAPQGQPRLNAEQFKKLVDASDIDTLLSRAINIGSKIKAAHKSTQYLITEIAMMIAVEKDLQDETLFWYKFCLECADHANLESLHALYVVWAAQELALAQEG